MLSRRVGRRKVTGQRNGPKPDNSTKITLNDAKDLDQGGYGDPETSTNSNGVVNLRILLGISVPVLSYKGEFLFLEVLFVMKKIELWLWSIFLVLICFLSTGILYGWTPLQVLIEEEGFFSERCPPDSDRNEEHRLCPEQVSLLNLVFTVGVTTTTVAGLPMGMLLDYWDEKKTSLTGCVILALGCTTFAGAYFSKIGLLLFVAYILMGLAVPCIFLSLIRSTRFFPASAGHILVALYNSAFDASILVFALFKVVVDHTSVKLGTLFLIYNIVPLVIAISIPFWPNKVQEKEEEEMKNIRKSQEMLVKGSWAAAWKQMKSPVYIGLVLYNCVNMTWLNTYLGTTEVQWVGKLGEEEGLRLAEVFGFILPLGFLVGPVVGVTLKYLPSYRGFFALTLLLTINAIIQFIPHLGVQVFNFCLFAILRAYYYALIADFTIEKFGFESFGKLFGLLQFIVGLVGISQSLFVSLTVTVFEGNWLPLNTFQLVTQILTLGYPLYLYLKEKKEKTIYAVLQEDR
ncbi:MFS transporter [Planoprotostelium fungivorum]|uniref:MFS transporter n=1 Tax=Planoprotostelium fungivorum TaxID=1890364 RepID=A0A2P6NZ98_9EUKA|nr:MFS transporter [Planoprotostelium fungivorum]